MQNLTRVLHFDLFLILHIYLPRRRWLIWCTVPFCHLRFSRREIVQLFLYLPISRSRTGVFSDCSQICQCSFYFSFWFVLLSWVFWYFEFTSGTCCFIEYSGILILVLVRVALLSILIFWYYFWFLLIFWVFLYFYIRCCFVLVLLMFTFTRTGNNFWPSVLWYIIRYTLKL